MFMAWGFSNTKRGKTIYFLLCHSPIFNLKQTTSAEVFYNIPVSRLLQFFVP